MLWESTLCRAAQCCCVRLELGTGQAAHGHGELVGEFVQDPAVRQSSVFPAGPVHCCTTASYLHSEARFGCGAAAVCSPDLRQLKGRPSVCSVVEEASFPPSPWQTGITHP